MAQQQIICQCTAKHARLLYPSGAFFIPVKTASFTVAEKNGAKFGAVF
jgi:hypothetical protein